MEIKTYDRIYEDMKYYILSNQDRLTDFNDGSVLASQVEAMARELALLYINCRVGFSAFMRSLPYSVFGFEMKEGQRAGVDVVFSRARPFAHETPIPAGTAVSAGALQFTTTASGLIKAGEVDSQPIPAIAGEAGEKGNVPADSITTIASMLNADVIKVNNPKKADGGKDAEDWASYIDRFSDYILGLGRTNKSGILTTLTQADIVRSMRVVEHFPPLHGIYNMTLYMEDGSGGMDNDKLAAAKKLVDETRPPGINIRYSEPEIIRVSVDLRINPQRAAARNTASVFFETEAAQAVQDYANSLKIGEPFLLAGLIVALKTKPVLDNVRITSPENDILVKTGQIIRYGSCNVTVELPL